MVNPGIIHNDVFSAVSDPTRRRILDILAHGEQAVMDIVREFNISQPSISEHLRILRNAGLVLVRPTGRQRLYSLNAAPMRELAIWIRTYERFLDVGLISHSDYLDRQTAPPSPTQPITYSHMPMELD